MGTEYKLFVVPRDRTWRPDAAALIRLLDVLREERWLPRDEQLDVGDDALAEEEERDFSPPTAFVYVEDQESTLPLGVDPAWVEERSAGELTLMWNVDEYAHIDLRYPFTRRDRPYNFCEISIHLTQDYVFEPEHTLFHAFQPPRRPRFFGWFQRKPAEPVFPGIPCACGARLDYTRPKWGWVSYERIRRHCESCGAPFDPTGLPATVQDGYGHTAKIPGGCTYRFALIFDCQKSIPSERAFTLHPDLISLIERHFGQGFETVSEYY